MAKPKLFITRELFEDVIKKLEEYYDVEVWDRYQPPPYEVLLQKAKEVDALGSLLTDRIDCNLLQQAKRLRIVAQYAVGYDNIDVECATRLGIYVTNTPGVLTEATAVNGYGTFGRTDSEAMEPAPRSGTNSSRL